MNKFFARTALPIFAFLAPLAAFAQTAQPLTLSVTSQSALSGTAGDYVNVTGSIANITTTAIANITTYLSLVDNQTKMPVDLEDWSAEKGLYIGSVAGGQQLPLNWKIHFVKAGDYSLIIVAETAGQRDPIVSTITNFHVNPKRNLNPGQVLPVALGMPLVVLLLISALYYRRQKEVQS